MKIAKIVFGSVLMGSAFFAASFSVAQDDVKALEEVMIVGAIKSAASQTSEKADESGIPELPVIVE